MANNLSKELGLPELLLDLEKSIKSLKSLSDENSILSKNVDEVSTSIKNATSTNKELEKIKKQLLDVEGKSIKIKEEETRKLIEDKIALQEQTKAITDSIKEKRNEEKQSEALKKALTEETLTKKQAIENNKALRKATQDINTTTEDGKKKLEAYNKIIDKNTSILKDNSDQQTKQYLNVGNYASALDNLPGPLREATGGVIGLGKSFLNLLTNPIVGLLALIVGALKGLFEAFKEFDFVQDLLADFRGVVATVFDSIKIIFENASRFISGTWDIIAGNTTKAIERIQKVIAILTRDEDGLKKINEEIAKSSETIANGYKKIGEAVDDSKDRIKKAYKDFTEAEKILLKLKREEVDLITDIAKLETESQQLRAKAFEKDKYNANERLDFLARAQKKEMEIIQMKRRALSEEIRATELQQEATTTSLEDSIALSRRKGELIKLDFVIAQNQEKFNKERFKLMQEEKKDIAEIEKIRLEGIKKQEDARKQLLDSRNKASENENKLLLANEKKFQNEALITLKERLIAGEITQKEYQKKITDIEFGNLNIVKERLKTQQDTLKEKLEGDLDLYKENEEKKAEILMKFKEDQANLDLLEQENALKTADANIKAQEENLKKKSALQESAFEFNKQLEETGLSETLGNLNKLFGANKLTATADAVVNTAQGVTKALSSLPPPLNFINAGLVGAAGAAQIAAINKTTVPSFAKGTDNAPKGVVEVGEAGREFILDKKGNLILIPSRTFLNLEGGEKIFNNKETERMLFNDNRIVNELKGLKNNMKVNNNIRIMQQSNFNQNRKQI